MSKSRLTKTAFKTQSVPFPERMKNAYGAWLAPDGTYVEVDWEQHAPVAWQIAREHGWEPKEDPDDPYKYDDNPGFIYSILFDHGYYRVTFETWSGKSVVGIESEDPTPPDPDKIIAAMRYMPNAELEITWGGGRAKYKHLGEYKEKNIASSPSVLDAPGSRYDPYGGAAWAAVSRWIKEAWDVSPEKHVPFTDADRETYGAWLAPDGTYYPVDEYRHDSMADAIIQEKDWGIPLSSRDPDSAKEAYETLYGKGYARVIFSLFKEPTGDVSQGDMISFATGKGREIKPEIVVSSMEKMPDVRIGVSDVAGWQHYANLAEYKARKGLVPREQVSPLGTSRYDPYGGAAWAATSRWLRLAFETEEEESRVRHEDYARPLVAKQIPFGGGRQEPVRGMAGPGRHVLPRTRHI